MCFSSLVLSRRPKIFKKRPQTLKIPSLLSAHAGIYIYLNVYNTSGHIYENLPKLRKSHPYMCVR